MEKMKETKTGQHEYRTFWNLKFWIFERARYTDKREEKCATMTHALLEATDWGSGSRISQQDRKFARWIHSWVRIDDKTCREGGWRRNFAQTPRPVEQSRDANVRTLRSLTAGTDRSTRTQVIRSEVVYLTWPRRRTTRADLLKPFQTVRCYTTLYRAWRIATDSLAGAWLRAGRRYSPPLLFPVTRGRHRRASARAKMTHVTLGAPAPAVYFIRGVHIWFLRET